ncbi:MATE family efflux transporter [Neolewinella aurantiaca]|uniref:MATE family efflux transporter n=1 Tax=Neolewinella aurantiaca TaxID=2602767 RepID=A0A5C7FXB2_9BACT|nr:MATE family efflux transporter [Neolewinella aurantiaca]TXF89586.1 MATE family efflux transporter [Neolewinella aurantiaca]
MNKEILRLAIPNILSNISVPLITSFDTVLMGGLSGNHIAAVGLGGMAFNFVYWNFGFLRMSTTGLTARAFGAEDKAAQMATLARAALLAAAISVLLILLQYPFAELTHLLLNLREEQVGMVDDYFYIRILAAPAALLQMVLFGWFFGRQNSVFPLILTLIVNAGNMALSWYLVKSQGWGIGGVAWGTVAAQYMGLGFGLVLWWWECRRGGLRFEKLSLNLRQRLKKGSTRDFAENSTQENNTPALREFLSVNRDIFLRTLFLTLSFAFFYNRANALDVGTAVVAANVILLQLVNWLSYGIDGFAFAAESLVGKYSGANKPKELNRVIWLIFVWGMAFAGLYAVVYAVGNINILRLFAPENTAPETLEAAVYYLPIVVAFCVAAAPCYLVDGIYIGLTAARAMRQTMLLAFAGYLLSYYLVGRHYENWGLWGSLLAFMVLRALIQYWWLYTGRVGLTAQKTNRLKD